MIVSSAGVLRAAPKRETEVNKDAWLSKKFVVLSNGVEMPNHAFGTRAIRGGECEKAIKSALDAGFRHVETSTSYGNFRAVRNAIADMDRGNLWLTVKISGHGHDHIVSEFRRITAEIGTSYIDLLMLDWAGSVDASGAGLVETRRESWTALQRLYSSRLCRAVGVCSMTIPHVLATCGGSGLPHVFQFEFHPYLQQSELLQFCVDNRIQAMGLMPLAGGRILEDDVVAYCAKETDVSPVQTVLRWSLQRGVMPVFTSRDPAHIAQGRAIFTYFVKIRLMKKLDALHNNSRFDWDPEFVEDT